MNIAKSLHRADSTTLRRLLRTSPYKAIRKMAYGVLVNRQGYPSRTK